MSLGWPIFGHGFQVFLAYASNQTTAEQLLHASKSVMMLPVELVWIGQASCIGNDFSRSSAEPREELHK